MPNQKTRERKKLLRQQQSPSEAAPPTQKTTQKAEESTTPVPKTATAAPPASADAVPSGERQRGVCRWYKEAKRYGFISGVSSEDIFVHAGDLNDLEIAEGDTLEYSVIIYNGRPKAVDVVKIAAAANAVAAGPAPPLPPISEAATAAPPAAASPSPAAQEEDTKEAPAAAPSAPSPAPAPPIASTGEEESGGRIDNIRRTGTTEWYTPKKRHGFITPDEPGQSDIFVHALDLLEPINEGDRVEYYVAKYVVKQEQKIKAVEVRKCGSPSVAAPAPSPASGGSSSPSGPVPTPPALKAPVPWGPKKETTAWANVAKGNKVTNGVKPSPAKTESNGKSAAPAAQKTTSGQQKEAPPS